MHIARAYCVEAEKVVDIYQARALFFAQDKPRGRFRFLCSDDACRGANATRVTGVNYDKLVEDERERVILKPHFRMNPETPHHPGCEWFARDRLVQALDSLDGIPLKQREERCFRRLRSSDLVDVFLPAQTAGTTMAPTATGLPSGRGNTGEATGVECGNTRNPTCLSNLTRSNFLETVVSAYELLEPEERRGAMLRIGRGARLPYSKVFCRIEHYFSARENRIFHGGVRVKPHGPNFAVQFFDRLVRADGAGKGNPLVVSLYLKRDALLKHWNGRFLLAQLTEASKPAHYAHCYFYGRVVDHPKWGNRVVVEVDPLEHLAFTVRKRTSAQMPDTGQFC